MSWQPEYPDFARARAPLAVAILTGFFAAPVEPPPPPPFDPTTLPLGQPSEPVRVPLRPVATDVAYGQASERWGLDRGELPWLPSFPDFPARGTPPGPVANRTGFAYVPAIAHWGIDGGQSPWRPAFPDFPGRGAPHGSVSNRTTWSYAVPPFWGLDRDQTPWRPSFPDALARTRATEGASVGVVEPPAAPPPEPLQWAPVYPRSVPPRSRTPASGVVAPVETPAPPPTVPEQWTPSYPSTIAARAAPTLGVVIVAPVAPPTAPPAPDLSWLPLYPVTPPARARPPTHSVAHACSIEPPEPEPPEPEPEPPPDAPSNYPRIRAQRRSRSLVESWRRKQPGRIDRG